MQKPTGPVAEVDPEGAHRTFCFSLGPKLPSEHTIC